VPKPEIGARVAEAARLLGLAPYLDRRPAHLSGGQRQRVAMGRAIVRRPKVFLMDEPLSNLDAKLRVQTRTQIASLQRELAVTTVYVTHDQVEAMTMGDRVAVLDGGVLQQCDTPAGLYMRPANVFVAGFIGSPAMNLLAATVRGDTARGARSDAAPRGIREGTRSGTRSGTRDTVRSGEVSGLARAGHWDMTGPGAWGGVRDGAPDAASGHVAAVDDLRVRITRAQRVMLTSESVVVGVRPEAFEVVSPDDGMAVTVEMVENIGSDSYLYCTAGARPSLGVGEAAEQGEAPHPLTVRTSGMSRYARGDRIGLRPEPGATHLFDAATGERLPD
jgi:multiple sugar transport system ATP-binding protein